MEKHKIQEFKNDSDSEDLRRYGPSSNQIHDRYYSLPSGVALRVVSFFYPESKKPPVLMITGLASVMESSKEITRALSSEYTVHYLETREKSSSRTNGDHEFEISAIGEDIVQIISELGLENGKYILFGASLGATAIVDSFQHLRNTPLALVLLEPNASFNIPRWSMPLIYLSPYAYRLIKPVVKFYIKNYRINIQEDYEMYKISSRAIDAADPYKLKKAVLSMSRYKIWECLDSVDVPTLIVAASKDHFHNHKEIVMMADQLKDCTYVDLETHQRTHSSEIAENIQSFLDGLPKQKT